MIDYDDRSMPTIMSGRYGSISEIMGYLKLSLPDSGVFMKLLAEYYDGADKVAVSGLRVRWSINGPAISLLPHWRCVSSAESFSARAFPPFNPPRL
jgi:hypothetical protein